MSIAIQIAHLSKTYPSQSGKKIKALADVGFTVEGGEILGILGPNGAGKTTLLNILSTLVEPDSGQAELLGIPLIPKNYRRIQRMMNMSSGYPNFPWSLTVIENLKFYGRLYGLSGSRLSGKVDELIETFQLQEFARQRFDELSSGTKQRLSLAKAFLNDPQILFLDEPTVGLDPDVAARARQTILRILKERKITVLFTTHYMPEAEMMCQRIAFIHQGRLLKMASPQELTAAQGKKNLEEVFIELAREGRTASAAAPVASVKTSRAVSVLESAVMDEEKLSFLENVLGWLNRTWAFTVRNTIFAMRNFFALAELIFWPVITLISIGLLGDFLSLKEGTLAFILTGAITAGILQVAQLDVSYSLLYDVWSKSVKHTFLAPTGLSESMFGSWVNGVVRGTAIFLVLGLAAMEFFGFAFPPVTVTVIFLAGIFASAILLGLTVTVLVLLFGQKADITAWMFAYLVMMLCGIYYPIQTLPPFFCKLALVFPMTYFLEYFRQSFGFVSGFDHLLVKGFGLTAIYLSAGLVILQMAVQRARQTGTIVRLSE